jgi:hypothetical protein
MTKIVWSLDSLPLTNNRWNQGNRFRETMIMYALSVLYAHLWYDDLELYCDEAAYEVLKVLPIKVTKIDFETNDTLWMDAKLKVLELQKRPFIHIDGDVFLQKPIEDFHNLNSPVIVERVEAGEQFTPHYKEQIDFFTDYYDEVLRHWNRDLGYSLNCGILGFSDLSLKNDYIREYKIAKGTFKDIQSEYQTLKDKGYEPCVVLEQFNLACLLSYRGIEPKTILKEYSLKQNEIFANRLGYCHLYGHSKYQQKAQIEKRLEIAFPYWYNKIISNL